MQAKLPKFKAWVAAENEAHDAERELYAAMLQFGTDISAPPLDDLVQSARTLRARAHGLFDEAMQEMKEMADSCHHRRILLSASGSLLTRNPRGDDADDSGTPSRPVQQ